MGRPRETGTHLRETGTLFFRNLMSFSGSIADQCEAFVDKNGQRLIDALVKDDLDPAEVKRLLVVLYFCSVLNKLRNALTLSGPHHFRCLKDPSPSIL